MSKTEIRNFAYCEDTKKLKEHLESSFLELGERLLIIRDGRLYEPQHTSFTEYVWELKMSEGTASKLINIFKRFVLEYGIDRQRLIDAGGWSNLAVVLPVIKSKRDAEYWLERYEVNSRPDVEKEVKELRTGLSQAECKHLDYYELRICNDCGMREKIINQQ